MAPGNKTQGIHKGCVRIIYKRRKIAQTKNLNPAEPQERSEKKIIWVGILLTLFSAIVWGSTYPAIQISLRFYNTYQISFFRAIFASLTLLTYYVLNRQKARRELSHLPKGGRNWSLLILTSILGSAGFWILLNLAVLYLQPDTATFIVALYPIITLALASIFLKEKLTANRGIGVLLGATGAYVLLSFGKGATISGREPVAGIVIALSSAFFFAGYIITSRLLIGRKYGGTVAGLTLSPEFVTLLTFLIATIPTFLFVLLTGSIQGLFQASLDAVIPVLYLGVVTSGIAFLAFNVGLKMIGASRAAINQLLFPAVSVVLSYWILGETINIADALGISLILAGIIVGQKFVMKKKQEKMKEG